MKERRKIVKFIRFFIMAEERRRTLIRWLAKARLPIWQLFLQQYLVTTCCVFLPRHNQLSEDIFFRHPANITIAALKIGRNCVIHQGVTIGGSGRVVTSFPTIEDDVTIYANSVIVGGVTVGKGSKVAAGAVVIEDVPPYTLVAGVPAKVVKYYKDNLQTG
ncbi:MAG: hypothetical protein LBS33_00915 [Streptococcaceae bacterium]|jgi:serine acetyltransferase|nr:hypothetical protein [Streptococcaceae bacterium]